MSKGKLKDAMMQDTFHSSIKIWSRQTYKYNLIKRDHIIITWIGDLWIFEYKNYILRITFAKYNGSSCVVLYVLYMIN